MEQRWNEGAAKAWLGNIGRILTGGREDLPPRERDETAKGSAAKAASVSIAPAAAAEEQDQNEDDPETAIIISAAHNQNPFSAQLIFAWPDPARCMDLAQCFPA